MKWGNIKMNKKFLIGSESVTAKKKIVLIAAIALSFVLGHIATMSVMEIETDGDGDSAYISVLGLEYFKGINGYSIK